MRRRLLILACLAALCLLAVAALPGAQGSTDARSGGIFRVSFQGSSSLQAFDHVDPALAYTRESWALLDTVCARLMRYRDRPPPEGYRIVPEVAAAFPKVSPDGKTTTFKLRSGFRFSDGTPVRADASPTRSTARWHRASTLRPTLYTQAIVGAADVKAGKRTPSRRCDRARQHAHRPLHPRSARLRRLDDDAVLLRRPADAPAQRGGRAQFPGAGPYTIREYRPDERIVLGRNRYYGGRRAHHVDGFHVDLSAGSPEEVLDRIESGKADWGYAPAHTHVDPGRHLIGKYGLNESRYFSCRG